MLFIFVRFYYYLSYRVFLFLIFQFFSVGHGLAWIECHSTENYALNINNYEQHSHSPQNSDMICVGERRKRYLARRKMTVSWRVFVFLQMNRSVWTMLHATRSVVQVHGGRIEERTQVHENNNNEFAGRGTVFLYLISGCSTVWSWPLEGIVTARFLNKWVFTRLIGSSKWYEIT